MSTVSSNQFDLPMGAYEIEITFPANRVNRHQGFLYNVTDTTYSIEGSSALSDTSTNDQSNAILKGNIQITATKTFQARHWTQTARTTDGLGSSMDFAPGGATSNNPQSVETFTIVKVKKTR